MFVVVREIVFNICCLYIFGFIFYSFLSFNGVLVAS